MVGQFTLTDFFFSVVSVFPPYSFVLTKKPSPRSHIKTPNSNHNFSPQCMMRFLSAGQNYYSIFERTSS